MFRIKARRKSSSVRKQPRVSSVSVGKFLQGARFPLSKKDLINIARRNKAPALILSVLRLFEDRRYINPMDISKEISRL